MNALEAPFRSGVNPQDFDTILGRICEDHRSIFVEALTHGDAGLRHGRLPEPIRQSTDIVRFPK
jgi:hypothetical protein